MKRILFVALALISFSALSAQEVASNTTIENQISEIDARLAKNEKRTALLEKAKQYFKITGFVQGEYDWLDDRKGHASTGSSSFYIRRARLSMAGDLYKGEKGAKLDYRLYIDLARVKLPNPNPILDMWVRYQPIKEFGVQLGQFKNPITFEASVAPSKYEFIDFSYAVCNLAKMGADDVAGLNVTARDAGFQFFGGFIHRDGYSIINYNVGLLNGNGINAKDDNKSKDVFGKITIKPSKDLGIALYYQRGEANLSGFEAEKYAEYGWSGNAEYVITHRWGGGFQYISDKVFARGEYIAGITGQMPSEGAYLQGGYNFKMPKAGKLWAGAMVDYFCRNVFDYTKRDTANAKIDTRYSVCLGYEPIKYFHMQLAFSLEQRTHYTFANNRHFGNGVKFMATVVF